MAIMKKTIFILLFLLPLIGSSQSNGNGGYVVDTFIQTNMKTVAYDITLTKGDSVYICEYSVFFNGWFTSDSANSVDGYIVVISHSSLVGIVNTFTNPTLPRFSVALVAPKPSNPGTMGRCYLYKCDTKVFLRNLRSGTGDTHITGKLEFFN